MTTFPPTAAQLHHLDNGLTLIIDDRVDAPVVSCQIWVETGSMHEFPHLGSGVSHLLEHMVFKGTAKYSGSELADTVQAAGGQWNAYTSFDRTVYYIDGPASSTETFLDCLCEMVFRPAFPKDDFELERDVIRREIDMGLDSPESQGSQLLFSTIYQRDGRRHPVIGHLELFNALSYDDMVSYHRRRYSPENVFISIAGRVDPEDIKELVSRLTPAERPHFDDQPIMPREPRQLGPRVRRQPFRVPTSQLTLAWQAPALDHADAPALDLLSSILGSGRSSALYRQLREERGLCHHIGAFSWLPPAGPGVFAISADVDADGRDALAEAVFETIEKTLANDLEAPLARAQRMSLTNQLHTLTTASGRASDLASNWHEARNLNYTRDYVEQLQSVTTADLVCVAKAWLTPQTLTTTSLDPIDAPESNTTSTVVDGQTTREISTHTLSNGLTVVLGQDSALPLINICTASAAGLPAEAVGTAGIGALLASQLDKGSNNHSAVEIANALDAAGARMGFASGNNTFTGKLECLREDLASILPLFADCLANPLLPEDSLERERSAYIAAALAAAEKPLNEAFRIARAELFSNEGYALQRAGSVESLEAITRADLAPFHSRHICAKNTILSVFGDFDPETIVDTLEQAFAALPRGERFATPASNLATGGSIDHVVDKKQAALVIAYPTAGLAETDEAALELLNAYTSDMSGPIFGRIREELGLAYSASTNLWHGVDAGMFAFYLATAPEQLDLAEAELLKEIETITRDGIPVEKFDSTKTSMLAAKELGNQANSARAMLSAVDTLLGRSPDNFRSSAAQVEALTPETVQMRAAQLLTNAPTIARVSPQ